MGDKGSRWVLGIVLLFVALVPSVQADEEKSKLLIQFADQDLIQGLLWRANREQALQQIPELQEDQIRRALIGETLRRVGKTSDTEFAELAETIGITEAQVVKVQALYEKWRGDYEALYLNLKAQEEAGKFAITCSLECLEFWDIFFESPTIEEYVSKVWGRFKGRLEHGTTDTTDLLIQLEQVRGDLEETRKQLGETEEKLKQTESARLAAQGQYTELKGQLTTLQQQNDALQKRLKELEGQQGNLLPWVLVGILGLVLAGLLLSRRSQGA